MKLEQQVVLITGASMGIGREIALALGRQGCRVALAARSRERLESVAAEIGAGALPVTMDVTNDASVQAAMAEIERAYGHVDVLVNNAGNGGSMSRWEQSDAAHTRKMFEVHVLGAERSMRAVLPLMQRNGGGTIVNFSSTLGYVAMPGTAAYNSAKAAVVMLSRTLRAELRPQGIDVRLFSPPHTKTEAGRQMPLRLPKIFEPSWVAAEFVRFLKGRRAELLAGGNGSLLALQRLSPALANRIMENIGFDALASLEAPRLTRPR